MNTPLAQKNSPLMIGCKPVGVEYEPFIVAELSGNHNQSIERACRLIEEAAAAGAHAVKLQTYTPESLTIDCSHEGFTINDNKSLWFGQNLYQLYRQACTPYEWHPKLFEVASLLGIECFSTPFDQEGLELLQKLGAPAYKIASFENADHALLKSVAATQKPVIMSNGATSLAEFSESVDVLKSNGATDLVLLKCTSNYPASPADSNIRTIPNMRAVFGCEVGLSDHTTGIGVSVAAVALGATFIEKHFCLDRSEGGVDSAFSLEPCELKSLVSESKAAWSSLGEVSYRVSEAEIASRKYRRSIYVIEDIQAGERIQKKHIRVIRPGAGLPPKYLEQLIGKRVACSLKRGQPLDWAHID